MRKDLDKITVTPELKEHYKRVGIFLKAHPEIQSKKLAIGFQVNIGTIPKKLIEEWLEVTTFKHKN